MFCVLWLRQPGERRRRLLNLQQVTWHTVEASSWDTAYWNMTPSFSLLLTASSSSPQSPDTTEDVRYIDASSNPGTLYSCLYFLISPSPVSHMCADVCVFYPTIFVLFLLIQVTTRDNKQLLLVGFCVHVFIVGLNVWRGVICWSAPFHSNLCGSAVDSGCGFASLSAF